MAGYLFDSNILIYAANPASVYDALRDLLIMPSGAVSAISQVEVLGFSRLSAEDRLYLEALFEALALVPVSNQVIRLAVQLGSQYGLRAPDAVITASALLTQSTLVTADQHFRQVVGLNLLLPTILQPS